MLLYLFFSCTKSIESLTEPRIIDGHKNVDDYSSLSILLTLQLLMPTSDSKDFVDRATKIPLKEVVSNFDDIKRGLNIIQMIEEIVNVEKNIRETSDDKETLQEQINAAHEKIREREKKKITILTNFIEENYHPVGYDIQEIALTDYSDKPSFIKDLHNKDLIKISNALNVTWKDLSRKTVELDNGGVSTLLDLPHPFVIPGGRFREYYYWDTYWILEGLLVSDMHETASNVIKNFIWIINTYGYIPNGTRKYYLYRSEPPYFLMMLLKLLDYEGQNYDNLVLNEGLEAAVKEYDWWMKNRIIVVVDKNKKKHTLNYYHLTSDYPRPESFREDFMTFEKQKERGETEMYTNIKSGAESGWDFSSRWLKDPQSIESIRASEQIPVDLNAILYRNERILHALFLRKGDDAQASKYLKLSQKRERAMNTILWNPRESCWMDYLYNENAYVDGKFYFSNIMPLIYEVNVPDGKNTYDILKKYGKELFGYIGGIPVSSDTGDVSGQQWDYPNVWAPHQHMMVDFLLRIKEDSMAFHVAKAFFTSVWRGYQESKMFFEKYDCNKLGFTGGGGEYTPQSGFGWTNGAILSFIVKFGDQIAEDYDFSTEYCKILKKLENKSRKEFNESPRIGVEPIKSDIVLNVKV